MAAARRGPQYVDIGVNLLDPMFKGVYNGKSKHTADLQHVLQRARTSGVERQLVTVGCLSELEEVYALVQGADDLFCTIGCHPTRTTEMDQYTGGPSAYIQQLLERIREYNRTSQQVVAIGECGLDYDRVHFAPADVQRRNFELQLDLAKKAQLPLFLHSRAAHGDFITIMRRHWGGLQSVLRASGDATTSDGGAVGVVHSFTGTSDELKELLDLGVYIGVNGCSLKTQDNLETVRQIPLDRLLLETDAPWCGIRPTHASKAFVDEARRAHAEWLPLREQRKPEKWSEDTLVKGRTEPCQIDEVASVVARLKEVSLDQLAQHAFRNTTRLFRLDTNTVG